MADTKSIQIEDLLGKGDGVLTKRGAVWTYPGCPTDPSGTNIVLPTEYVTDAVVQAALADGTLVAAVVAPGGHVSSVRLSGADTPVVMAGLAGTAEMGTELPPGSRVESDAGARPVTAAEAEKQATEALAAATGKAPAAEPSKAAPAPVLAKAGR